MPIIHVSDIYIVAFVYPDMHVLHSFNNCGKLRVNENFDWCAFDRLEAKEKAQPSRHGL